MALIQRGLMIMATAGALAIPAHLPAPVDAGGGTPAKKIAVPTTSDYQPSQLEYYLGDSGLAYIRPGFNIKIVAVTNNGAGQKPIVELLFTDDVGMPLDRSGGQTPGVITMSFAMARWDPATRYYVPITGSNATRGGADSGGTWTDLEVGHYKYNFGQAVPAAIDVTAGVTMTIYGAQRNLTSILGKNYIPSNSFYDFRADGKVVAVGQVWGVVGNITNSCNKCHDPLGGLSGATSGSFHGGLRNQPKACALCHTYGLGTNGEANARVFFHKLHMGNHLPSVVAGGTYTMAGNNYSTVGWPGANNSAPMDCTTCHEQSAPEKDVWKTKPGMVVCGSCHDDVDFTKVHGGTAPPQVDDSKCASCHPSDPPAGVEFDASVKGAHVVPAQSAQLKGLVATIVSATNMAPGKKPTVVYKITNGDGKTAVDGGKLAAFAPMFAGPTTSYTTYVRESAVGKSTFDATAGTTTYTFTGALPATASGTWAVSVDIERAYSLVRGDGKANITGNESPLNPFAYYSVDGSAVVARRTAVTMTQCNACHGRLGLHGGQRLVIEECVMCHNPMEGDQARRPATANPPESVSFQRLIHRIHTGEELTQPFTIYGYGGSVNDFTDVRFPGDRRNCAKCHTSTGYLIPLADERSAAIGSVNTLRDYFSPQGPGTAACLGCHDLRDNAAHAYLNTAPFGEACASCHGAGLDYGVDKVHAR
jgi:OmcA/MtrC family decaheme c-type cytochrome